MIDTHAHLNTEAFQSEIEDVINRAKRASVDEIIVVGMYEEANQKALTLTKQYNNLYASVGLHPSYVDEGIDFALLEAQLQDEKVVALGEIGIDLYWVKDNLDKQIRYFKKQIELAIKHKLPIIVHSRNSSSEIYEVLKEYQGRITGVMHCFSDDMSWANQFLNLGFYIGIGGVVTFKNAKEVKEVAKNVPLERLLVETDSPYLAPTPHRGKKNEPAYTAYVLEAIAQLRQMTKEELNDITTKNAKRLFNKMEG